MSQPEHIFFHNPQNWIFENNNHLKNDIFMKHRDRQNSITINSITPMKTGIAVKYPPNNFAGIALS